MINNHEKSYRKGDTMPQTTVFKRILASVMIPALMPAVLFTSCGKDAAEIDTPIERFVPQSKGIEADDAFTESICGFSESLFRESLVAGKNLVISPLSVTYALTMTANGASGETLAEFNELLNSNSLNGGVDVAAMNEYLCSLTHRMAETKESTVEIANSVWANKNSFTVNETFRDTVLAYYGAEVSALDFTKRESVDTINQWVSARTDGMIEKTLDTIDPSTAMILLNTVLFDGKWAVPYEETDLLTRDFFGYNGTTENAEFLTSTEHSYFEVENGVGFSKAYKDGYKFIAILPNEGVDVYDFARELDLSSALRTAEMGSNKVICQVPKFEYEAEVNLNEILQRMGLKRAFSPNEAELENLGTSDIGSLYISKVFQKAKIKLDENGTKATAVTAVVVTYTCAAPTTEPKRIILDRPFVYMIADTETGVPLFMGILADLKG